MIFLQGLGGHDGTAHLKIRLQGHLEAEHAVKEQDRY